MISANVRQMLFMVALGAAAHWNGALFVVVRSMFLLLALLTTFLVLKQNDILYIPHPDPSIPRGNLTNPREYADMPFEDVWLAVDNEKAHGWLIKQSDSDTEQNRNATTLIYFHGNAGNISNRLPYYKDLWSHLRFNILAVDYRGYGDSEGYPTEEGIRRDAEEFLKFALNHPDINPDRLVVFGRSLGGAVGIDLAARVGKIKALIVENTFLSIADIAFVLYPFLKVVSPFLKKPILKNEWLSRDKIRNVSAPILFISGGRDELIPPEHMKELYRLSRQPPGTRFCTVPEGTHNDTPIHGGMQYYESIRDFVNMVYSGPEVLDYHSMQNRRDTNMSEASMTDDEDFHMFS